MTDLEKKLTEIHERKYKLLMQHIEDLEELAKNPDVTKEQKVFLINQIEYFEKAILNDRDENE